MNAFIVHSLVRHSAHHGPTRTIAGAQPTLLVDGWKHQSTQRSGRNLGNPIPVRPCVYVLRVTTLPKYKITESLETKPSSYRGMKSLLRVVLDSSTSQGIYHGTTGSYSSIPGVQWGFEDNKFEFSSWMHEPPHAEQCLRISCVWCGVGYYYYAFFHPRQYSKMRRSMPGARSIIQGSTTKNCS